MVFRLRITAAVIMPFLVAAVGIQTGAANSLGAADPIALYGKEMRFDVRRNGEPVGQHRVTFSRTENGQIRVVARLDLTVRFFGVPVYLYEYRSDARWIGGRLFRLNAEQNDDGAVSTVRVVLQGKLLVIEGPKGSSRGKPGLYPTNHWNAAVLNERQVIDTLEGRVANVTIRDAGREQVRAEGRVIETTKYVYNGDIETTTWYDDDRRWVKMRFVAKGGSVIDYECIRCGLGASSGSMN
jgi:hypothetical protein